MAGEKGSLETGEGKVVPAAAIIVSDGSGREGEMEELPRG